MQALSDQLTRPTSISIPTIRDMFNSPVHDTETLHHEA